MRRSILNNKKGLAEIITVILIILLSLAAIAIIWQVIKPLIYKTTSQVSLSCTTGVELSITSATCTGDVWKVKLERGNAEDEVKSIKFVFSDATNENSKTIELTNIGNQMPDGLDVITYSFNKTSIGFNASKVKIAPTMQGEGSAELPCPVVSEKACTN